MSEYILDIKRKFLDKLPDPDNSIRVYTNYIIKINKNHNLFVDKQYEKMITGSRTLSEVIHFLNSSNFNDYLLDYTDINELNTFLKNNQSTLSGEFEKLLIQKIHYLETKNKLIKQASILKFDNNKLKTDNDNLKEQSKLTEDNNKLKDEINSLTEQLNNLKDENNKLKEENYIYKRRIMFRDNKN